MKTPASKNDFCLVLCCCLAASMIAGVFLWMDEQHPLMTSEQALIKAEGSVKRLCNARSNSCSDMTLMDAAPPSGNGEWQFRFFSADSGPMTIGVTDSGKVRVLPQEQTRNAPAKG